MKKMFCRALRSFVKNNVFGKCRSAEHKMLRRSILTTSNSSKQQLDRAEKESEIIIDSPFPSLNYPDLTIDQYVFKDLNKWSNKIALVDGITNRAVTYGKMRDLCRALSIRLQVVFKLNHGDTIAVCLPNSIEFPIIVLGGLEAGVEVTTVNPIYTAEEISRQLINSDSKVIFGYAIMKDLLQRAVQMTKRQIKIVYIKLGNEAIPEGGIDYNELVDPKNLDLSCLRTRDRDSNEIAVLPYSSGTTGMSKGVMLSHKNIVSNSIMLNSDTGNGCVTYPAEGDYQDVLANVLPFFHIYGLTCTLLSKLAHGCKLITLPQFKPETYLNVLQAYKCSVLYLVPPIIIFINNYDKIHAKHTESIKYCMSGAAPLSGADVERFREKAPNVQFFQGYGLTEASPVVLMSAMGSTNFASVGWPTPDTQAKIVAIDDPDLLGVGPNISGELLVRGPQIMLGYHKNEVATKEMITPDGWLRTGDIGHYTETHEFYITDRLKELIKVKGFQVPPAELEELLRDHPKIADAAVIGIPNHASGELPRAYVVAKTPDITEDEIKRYIASKVAEYKCLTGGVEFIKAIPKNATGKILRRELKNQFLR